MENFCSICGSYVGVSRLCPFCGNPVVSEREQETMDQHQRDINRAVAFLRAGRWEEARELAKKLAERTPEEAVLYAVQAEAITQGYTLPVSAEDRELSRIWFALDQLGSVSPEMARYREWQEEQKRKQERMKEKEEKYSSWIALVVMILSMVVCVFWGNDILGWIVKTIGNILIGFTDFIFSL